MWLLEPTVVPVLRKVFVTVAEFTYSTTSGSRCSVSGSCTWKLLLVPRVACRLSTTILNGRAVNIY